MMSEGMSVSMLRESQMYQAQIILVTIQERITLGISKNSERQVH